MKTKEEEFYAVMQGIMASDYFGAEDTKTKKIEIHSRSFKNGEVEKEEVDTIEVETAENEPPKGVEILEEWQDKALEEHGGFLALVPKEDYYQVAFDVLNAIYTYNLSQSEQQYRIATTSSTRDALRPIENDIKLAKQYRESINPSDLNRKSVNSLELIALVDLNISELEQYLEWIKVEVNPKQDEIIEASPSVTTFNTYKYETSSRKFLKTDITAILNRIVNQYNLHRHSNSIKKLITSL